ncbi:MAG: DMT family transporter [Elusimicrobia bacterium]|nr:DMT family transporter [Elusimicrobiota bacterium]
MTRRGALLMLFASILFAGMGVLVKIASGQFPNEMVVFFRNAAGLIILTPWLLRSRAEALRTRYFRLHLARGLIGLAAMYCFFYSIGHMPLADAMLLSYTAPLFMPFIAQAWLGEKIPRGAGALITLGFAGVMLTLKPGPGLFRPVALVALVSGFLGALAQVGIRGLAVKEPTVRIVFYFALTATTFSAVPLAGFWKTPTGSQWAVLAAIGVLATAAQLLLTRAYKHAPAGQVGPFIYTAVVFAGLFDWLIWKNLPDVLSILGALLIGLAGVLIIRRAGEPAVPIEG